jgi:hypothetical protein
MLNLGSALVADAQYAEAETLLTEGYNAARRQASLDPRQARSMAQKLVELYTGWGKLDEASEWRQKAKAR